jgi:hypothetical protein
LELRLFTCGSKHERERTRAAGTQALLATHEEGDRSPHYIRRSLLSMRNRGREREVSCVFSAQTRPEIREKGRRRERKRKRRLERESCDFRERKTELEIERGCFRRRTVRFSSDGQQWCFRRTPDSNFLSFHA